MKNSLNFSISTYTKTTLATAIFCFITAAISSNLLLKPDHIDLTKKAELDARYSVMMNSKKFAAKN